MLTKSVTLGRIERESDKGATLMLKWQSGQPHQKPNPAQRSARTTGSPSIVQGRGCARAMPANTTELEKGLWGAADELRANSKLKSSEYSVPVLGLIFLDRKSTRLN